jgi:hypothetical protein
VIGNDIAFILNVACCWRTVVACLTVVACIQTAAGILAVAGVPDGFLLLVSLLLLRFQV